MNAKIPDSRGRNLKWRHRITADRFWIRELWTAHRTSWRRRWKRFYCKRENKDKKRDIIRPNRTKTSMNPVLIWSPEKKVVRCIGDMPATVEHEAPERMLNHRLSAAREAGSVAKWIFQLSAEFMDALGKCWKIKRSVPHTRPPATMLKSSGVLQSWPAFRSSAESQFLILSTWFELLVSCQPLNWRVTQMTFMKLPPCGCCILLCSAPPRPWERPVSDQDLSCIRHKR